MGKFIVYYVNLSEIESEYKNYIFYRDKKKCHTLHRKDIVKRQSISQYNRYNVDREEEAGVSKQCYDKIILP